MSNLATIHDSGGVIRAALEGIDTWRTARDAVRLLDAHQLEPAHPHDARATLSDQLLVDVLAGRPVPQDIVGTAQNLTARREAGLAVNEAVASARAELRQMMDAAVQCNWSALFRGLDSELQEVLDQARGLARLDELSSADAAVAADRVDDFKAWQAVLRRHATVRSTQSMLIRRADLTVRFPETAYLRSPEAVWADWTEWRVRGYVEDEYGNRTRLTPPWPVGDDGHVNANLAGSASFLSWALDADVELIVPTPAELEQERIRLEQVLHPEPVESLVVGASTRTVRLR